ncbi:MAG: dienelactone hydrolase family protein [Phycisphaerales bacterium]
MTRPIRTLAIVTAALALPLVLAPATHAQSAPSPSDRAAWHENRTKQLTKEFHDAYEAGAYEEAIRAGYELVRHDQLNGLSAYNLACAFALDGRLDEAAKWLRNAGTHGYDRPEHARHDPDFDAIRDHPVYREAMLVIRTNREHDLEQFKVWWDRQPLIVIKPELEPEGPAPLIVALHGYGSTGQDMAERWRKVASDAGAVLVAPESGRTIEGQNGFQWTMEDEAEWIVRRSIERAQAHTKIDAERIVLTGFSQGGYIAIRHGLKFPESVAGVIPVAGLYDAQRTPFNEFKPSTPLPRFYLMVGARDEMLESMRTAEKAFDERGGQVELVVYDNVGHTFPPDTDEELAKALEYVLHEHETPSE